MPRPRKAPLPTPEGYITTREVVEILGVGLTTLYRWRDEYEDFPQPSTKERGKHSWFKRDDIIAWKRLHVGE
jgi:predicted DNA-binding transcriptional regulator AlpA